MADTSILSPSVLHNPNLSRAEKLALFKEKKAKEAAAAAASGGASSKAAGGVGVASSAASTARGSALTKKASGAGGAGGGGGGLRKAAVPKAMFGAGKAVRVKTPRKELVAIFADEEREAAEQRAITNTVAQITAAVEESLLRFNHGANAVETSGHESEQARSTHDVAAATGMSVASGYEYPADDEVLPGYHDGSASDGPDLASVTRHPSSLFPAADHPATPRSSSETTSFLSTLTSPSFPSSSATTTTAPAAPTTSSSSSTTTSTTTTTRGRTGTAGTGTTTAFFTPSMTASVERTESSTPGTGRKFGDDARARAEAAANSNGALPSEGRGGAKKAKTPFKSVAAAAFVGGPSPAALVPAGPVPNPQASARYWVDRARVEEDYGNHAEVIRLYELATSANAQPKHELEEGLRAFLLRVDEKSRRADVATTEALFHATLSKFTRAVAEADFFHSSNKRGIEGGGGSSVGQFTKGPSQGLSTSSPAVVCGGGGSEDASSTPPPPSTLMTTALLSADKEKSKHEKKTKGGRTEKAGVRFDLASPTLASSSSMFVSPTGTVSSARALAPSPPLPTLSTPLSLPSSSSGSPPTTSATAAPSMSIAAAARSGSKSSSALKRKGTPFRTKNTVSAIYGASIHNTEDDDDDDDTHERGREKANPSSQSEEDLSSFIMLARVRSNKKLREELSIGSETLTPVRRSGRVGGTKRAADDEDYQKTDYTYTPNVALATEHNLAPIVSSSAFKAGALREEGSGEGEGDATPARTPKRPRMTVNTPGGSTPARSSGLVGPPARTPGRPASDTTTAVTTATSAAVAAVGSFEELRPIHIQGLDGSVLTPVRRSARLTSTPR